jgi:pyroglutamyl-peptidase
MPVPARLLLVAARRTRVPVALSDDAGGYLCNYLCWRAAEAARKAGGPRVAGFVHAPNIARGARKSGKLTLDDLNCAGIALLTAVSRACHV